MGVCVSRCVRQRACSLFFCGLINECGLVCELCVSWVRSTKQKAGEREQASHVFWIPVSVCELVCMCEWECICARTCLIEHVSEGDRSSQVSGSDIRG